MRTQSSGPLDLLRLIDRIYSDAIVGSSTNHILEEIRTTLSLNFCSIEVMDSTAATAACAAGGVHVGLDPDDVKISVAPTVNVSAGKLLERYTTRVFGVDPLRRFAVENGSTGFLNLQSELYGRRIIDTDYYNEFAKLTGAENFFRTVVCLGGNRSVGISFDKGRSAGGFSTSEKTMIHGIIPHLKNASIIDRVVKSSEANDREILRSQQQQGKCGFVLDALGNVVSMNENGRELASLSIGVELDDGALKFADADAQESIDSFLLRCPKSDPSSQTSQLIEFPLRLRGFPIHLRCRAIRKTLNFSAQDLNKRFAVLEVASNWKQGWAPIRDVLNCDVLTLREKQVLFSLIRNPRENEAAEELEIRLSTLRTHRKRLYSKMQLENRRMLIDRF